MMSRNHGKCIANKVTMHSILSLLRQKKKKYSIDCDGIYKTAFVWSSDNKKPQRFKVKYLLSFMLINYLNQKPDHLILLTKVYPVLTTPSRSTDRVKEREYDPIKTLNN